ncbi:aldo/keto reductase [Kineococcus aurantiacus]|uniref:D-threo-aldose 1-dehydrogenase n=1 Tax=Kineococcus aurantiacus TaxID=37633 RepID=A0A7Y9DID0_9ACTN|nr:D-threo-aldose 1-dehydrogenase [Kineococcus aurantiacus]
MSAQRGRTGGVDVLTPRPLGRTGFEVTGLCVGTAELGDMTNVYSAVPEEQALATARRAFAGPLTFVDTSNGYGSSEQRLGTVLRELGGVPEGILLATKVDPLDGGPFDGPRVRASVAESMERLGLDHLPLLHLHDPERIEFEAATAPGGPVDVMRELVAEGLVGHLGVAGGTVDLMRRFVDTGVFSVVLNHNRWTLLDRSAGPLLDDCAASGTAFLNGAPFGGGILAKGPAAVPRYCYGPASPELLRAAERIEAACARHGVPLAAAALQDSLREPRVTSTVVGSSRPERLDQTLALAAHPVPDELWTELADLVPPKEHWLP